MTTADRPWVERGEKVLQIAGNMILVAGSVVGVVIWLGGGLKPGSQVQGEQVQASVERLSRQVGLLNDKLDAMPRPSDYAAQDAHLRKIDDALDAIRTQMGRMDVDAATLRTKIDRLDGTPVRQPR